MMDSGHSGSIQSSSGNEEEFDSRAAAGSFNTQPQFPFANNLLQVQMPTFNSPWSIPRSQPNTTSFVPHQLQPVVAARVAENNNLLLQQSGTEKQTSRNQKKRSRASRRAPTTILNTDTSNFRAMVQQFTGVPSTPFHDHNNNININVNKRSRLSDLFGSGSTTSNGSSAYSPPYLLRPFAQKPTTPSPLASSSHNNSLLPTIDEAARKFSSNVFDVENPIGMNSLVFQNNPSFSMSNNQLQGGSSSSFGSYMMMPTSNEEAQYYNNNSVAKMGGLNDHQFGLISHGNDNVNGLPNLISSERKDGQTQKEAGDQENNNNNNNNMYPVNNRNGR